MIEKSSEWRTFEEAREYVRSLGLKNLLEWLAWATTGLCQWIPPTWLLNYIMLPMVGLRAKISPLRV